jgi:cyclopropane fatty-acyl-phospholipid synthase-like methyltransferase
MTEPRGHVAADSTGPESLAEDDYRSRLYRRYATTQGAAGGPTERDLRRTAARLEMQIGRHLPADRSAVILDVGCGAGAIVWFLERRGYTSVRGIDVSAEQVARARAVGLAGIEQAEAHEYLGAHPDSFDLITLFDVLEHIPRHEVVGFLELVRGALRAGGQVVVHTVNGESPFAGRYLFGDFTHETAYTARSINQLTRLVGFRKTLVFEEEPAPNGLKGTVRWGLWKVLRTTLTGFLAVETGVVRGHIVSQNLIAVIAK